MKNNFKIIRYILIVISIIILFYAGMWLYYIIGYNNYHNHMKPFVFMNIYQTGSYIDFWNGGGFIDNGTIELEISKENKKLYFKYMSNSEKLKTNYLFDSKDYIGYEMCYKNDYGEYCFGKIK